MGSGQTWDLVSLRASSSHACHHPLLVEHSGCPSACHQQTPPPASQTAPGVSGCKDHRRSNSTASLSERWSWEVGAGKDDSMPITDNEHSSHSPQA